MLSKWLFKHIDNSALIVFRVLFGLLIFLESVGAILTGWVERAMIDPQFTFTFIGFEWLQPLPGHWMYAYYLVMGVFGFCVMIGYRYRLSIITFTIMWAITYLMQKASYNNHYYLLILLSAIMAFQPANRYLSWDAKKNPSIVSHSMPQWCSFVFILQMGIVYTYGAIAKLYPDWLDTTVIEIFMRNKQHYYLIGDFIQEKWFHYFIAYGGIGFDLFVVPLLLWKRIRQWAFFASIFFHLFNSIVFQVGIFPYMSLAFILFFYDPKTIRNIFLKKKPLYEVGEIIIPDYGKPFAIAFVLYITLQILLPMRHWAIKDDVLWTEEGHRMSWRMMLRTKSGKATYKVVDKGNQRVYPVKLRDYLSRKQQGIASVKPDIIWQFAQHLKKEYEDKGMDVAVYVNCSVRVNGKPLKPLIDPDVDLASVKWDVFKHSDWILPYKQE
jgi:hypothetical protein